MIEKNEDYRKLIKKHLPRSTTIKNSIFAFLSGGALCFMGEWLAYLYTRLGAEVKDSYLYVTLTFIVVASLLTAFGVYDKIARYCGAGTLLPVCGFSNSVTSSALDGRFEGYVSGVGTKIFSLAGPVILYSTLFGTIYGVIYYFVTR